MCGIAGYIAEEMSCERMEGVLRHMTDVMRRRGPEGSGAYTAYDSGHTLGLGHCRLAIIDLTDRGAQPMATPDGELVLTYNGEVYNHKELRAELEQLGHTFRSDCDTEVVLNACREWGVERAVARFNGMFAFALYDRRVHKIFLARDRLGVKPLYYWKRDGEFAFASDLKALMTIPRFEKEVDTEALYGFLWNMYIPTPRTSFRNAYKLVSGAVAEYDVARGTLIERRYWTPEPLDGERIQAPYEVWLAELTALLKDAVRLRLEADVPVGVFLSGGIDSSLIASLAQEISPRGIDTYSIGFYEKRDDDAAAASKVAEILGTRHHELYCTPADAIELIREIPKAYSEPFADNSQIPTMLLSRLTREHVTVSLSGDGGDELFIGYPSYLSQVKLGKTALLSIGAAATAAPIVRRLLPSYDHKRWLVEKFSNARGIGEILQLDYMTAAPLLDGIFAENIRGGNAERPPLYTLYSGGHPRQGEDILSASVMQSVRVSLQDDMLAKVDRATMHYSLECRCPLLDYRVAEIALRAPNGYKCRDGRLKAPLKDILAGYIPQSIIERPKSGFGVPINQWLHGELNELVNDYLSETHLAKQSVFDLDGMRRFVKEFNERQNPVLDRIAYCMLMFQLWWEEYCG